MKIPSCLHMTFSNHKMTMCGSLLTPYKHKSKRLDVVASASTSSITSTPSSSVKTTTTPKTIAKQRLLDAIQGTQRGSEAWPIKRGSIEEAQVAVESHSPFTADWSMLEGTWDVIYTTASDVVPLVKPGAGIAGFPLSIGRVGQRFTSPDQGIVQNLIEITLFDGGLSATLVVEASYEIRTARSIALQFRSAGVDDVVAGDDVQNLLAPALLPRGWLNMQVLMALEQLSITMPLNTRLPGVSSSSRQPVGINYNITYLDEDMLIGRAQGNGGTFIFTKRG